ncbi:MAG: ATPase, partial [Acidobacteriota bacterium]|nr:ATPase [Acidobacteriota bacterium]
MLLLSAGTYGNVIRFLPPLTISDELLRYAVDLCGATRRMPELHVGASPRATLMLLRCAQVLALTDGLAHVLPEHLQELALPILGHR